VAPQRERARALLSGHKTAAAALFLFESCSYGAAVPATSATRVSGVRVRCLRIRHRTNSIRTPGVVSEPIAQLRNESDGHDCMIGQLYSPRSTNGVVSCPLNSRTRKIYTHTLKTHLLFHSPSLKRKKKEEESIQKTRNKQSEKKTGLPTVFAYEDDPCDDRGNTVVHKHLRSVN